MNTAIQYINKLKKNIKTLKQNKINNKVNINNIIKILI